MTTNWPAPVPPDRVARAPRFLVVSPPKTGSTWLAANLRHHPGVFVPAVKELKYFSSLWRWAGPDWYLDQFAPAGGRLAGEASPSYALLPSDRIHLLRRLIPDLKLVVLLRDPVGRAWSHVKHTRHFREAHFADAPADGPPDWRAGLAHPWVAAAGDYPGQLRRWLAVFPRDQVYIDFYERIAADPAGLLRDVFTFLGVDPAVDLNPFPLRERILAGPPGEPPADVRDWLRRECHPGAAATAAFLRDRLRLEPPPEWADVLASGGCEPPVPVGATGGLRPPLARNPTEHDHELARLLDLEATFSSAHARLHDDHLGYDLSFCRGRVWAVARTVGPADLPEGLVAAGDDVLRRLADRGDALTAPTLAELRERVARHVAERSEGRVRELEAGLAAA
ncbi:MAG: sulfotransferase domain-containing protein, partial [Gemmataceae bacterium]|nr:sulfotransferase domain-containing protein [Gemmataceae bacterium]